MRDKSAADEGAALLPRSAHAYAPVQALDEAAAEGATPAERATRGERARDVSGGTSARFDTLDVAKGVAILLVVAGHCERGLVNAGILAETPLVAAFDAWIYAWHVPVFFLVAGLLMPRVIRGRTLGDFTAGRLARLAWPYALWAPLMYIVQSLAPSNTRPPLADIWRTVYEPPGQFWFVYVLLLHSLLFGALWTAGMRRTGWLLLAAGTYYLVHGLGVPLGWDVLHMAVNNLPFFAAGVVLSRPEWLQGIATLRGWQAAALACVGFGLVTVLVHADVVRDAAVIAGLAGCAGALGFAALLSASPVAGVFRVLGQRSIEIYVVHTIASAGVRIVLSKALGVQDAALHFIVGTLVGVLAPLALAVACDRVGLPWVFAWPRAHAQRERQAIARP